MRAAVIEVSFQIPFVSSLPKPAKLQTLSPSGPNSEQALEYLGDDTFNLSSRELKKGADTDSVQELP